MSEDVIVHFRQAQWEEIVGALDSLAPRHPKRSTRLRLPPNGWLYPDGLEFVTLERYTDYLADYEPEVIEVLHALLGGPPSCSLGINFRRQTRYNVCTIVRFLVLRLLDPFPGVVDDLLGELWLPEEIQAGVAKSEGRFMDAYCAWQTA